MLIVILAVLLLIPPTYTDTWWNNVDVIFGHSHRSIPYPRREGGGGSGRGEQEEDEGVVVLLGIADTTATVGRIFEYSVRNNAFLGNISHLTVREAGQLNLPHWMFFNDTTNTLLGLATDVDVGSTVIEVTAHSSTNHVTSSFVIDVKPANQLHPAWSHDVVAQPLKFLRDGDAGRRNDIICAWDETVIYTTLIVDAEVENLSADQRVKTLCQFARYLSRDVRTITFAAVKKREPTDGFPHPRVLVAGPGNVGVKGRRTTGAELFWVSGCGEFTHSTDVATVMERNIKSGKVTASIGLGVIGWYVWDNRAVARRFKRQIRGTPRATLSMGTPPPTRLPPLTTVTRSTMTQSRPSHVSTRSPSTETPSSITHTSTGAAASSSAIAMTPSFVLPSSSPVATSVSMTTTFLLSTSSPESSTSYATTSTTVSAAFSVATTPLTVTTMPLAVVTTPLATMTTPLSVATMHLAVGSTAVPGMSVSSVQILPTKSTEVVMSSEPSLTGLVTSEPVRLSTSVLSEPVSATVVVSSSPIEETTFVKDTSTSLFEPSSTLSSSMSVDETVSMSTTPLVFKSDSVFLSAPVTSSLSTLGSTAGFTSAYAEVSSGVILPDITGEPSLVVTEIPSSQVTHVETAAIDATTRVDVWASAIASKSLTVASSLESGSTMSQLLSTTDMASVIESVSMATSTRLPTPDVTAAVSSDLYSPAMSSTVLPQMTTQMMSESPGSVVTHALTMTVSQGSTSTYTSVIPHSLLQSDIVTSAFSLSPSDTAQSTVLPPGVRFNSAAEAITSSPVLKSSIVESSSVEEFSSTAAVFEAVASTSVFTSSLAEYSPSLPPDVSTASPGVGKRETSIYASVTVSPSVTLETSSLVLSTASTGLYPESPSVTSIAFTPLMTTSPLPSTRVRESVTTATATSSLTSVLPLDTTSSLTVSSSSHVMTTSTMPVTSKVTEVTTTSTMPVTSKVTEVTTTSTMPVTSKVTEVTTTSTMPVTSKVTEVTTTPAAPQPPRLMNPIHKILVRLGTYFEYRVPAETFYDTQDGDTTRLSLRLVTINNSTLPSNTWLQLDAGRQVVYGLPLRNDVTALPSEYVLVASNSHGLTTVAAIQVVIDLTILDDISHRFIVTFRLDYADFMRTPLENLKAIVKKLDVYLGDVSSVDIYGNSRISVTGVTEGSVQMAWTNNSLSKTSCDNETIMELFARMSHNGSLSDVFQRFMLPQSVAAVGLDLLGVCGDNRTVPIDAMGGDGVGSTDGQIWLVTIIPALVVVVLVVVIILIVVLRNKRRSRRGQYLPDSEKPIFRKNRKPVLMPEEMEMLDLGLRPKKPVTMPTDNQNFYANAAYEPDAVPPPPYQQPGSLLRQAVSPPVYDVTGMCNTPPPTYRLPPPYVANSNDTVLL